MQWMGWRNIAITPTTSEENQTNHLSWLWNQRTVGGANDYLKLLPAELLLVEVLELLGRSVMMPMAMPPTAPARAPKRRSVIVCTSRGLRRRRRAMGLLNFRPKRTSLGNTRSGTISSQGNWTTEVRPLGCREVQLQGVIIDVVHAMNRTRDGNLPYLFGSS
jgi:hypothetical protein